MTTVGIDRILSCFPKRRAVMLSLGFLLLFAPLGRGADALSYFKNYFVTGDYTVAGVGLRGTGVKGLATGTINMNAVPCTKGVGRAGAYVPCWVGGAVPADIVAAFLYWETEESAAAPAASNGFFDGNAIVGKNLGNPNNPSCWNSENGSTPSASGRVYRADVLRYLKIDTVNSVRLANGSHTVKLPDNGTTKGPNVLLTNGATLVVIYRIVVPGNPLFAPLRAVVLYDGAFTLTKRSPAMTQTIGGFYQATGDDAKMSPIVANGQPNFTAVLRQNDRLIGPHPFTGSVGSRWDNPTFPIDVDDNDSSYTTEVDSVSDGVCLTWAAIVSSVPVVDTDRDGLLDVWETRGLHLNPGTASTPATFGGCADYPREPCVNLPAMGANPRKRDIFVQIDWTHGNGDGTGGTDKHGFHLHMPKSQALAAVCATFAGQPNNIALHFDVGNNYQGQPCIIPNKDGKGNVLTQGGSDIDEATLLCPNAVTPAADCTYSEPYAVLSWKRTFLGVKNGYPVLNIPQHFDHDRKDVFHYSLWSHALAGPFDPTTGKAQSHDPKSISGVADRPGGDLMITLGLWRSDVPANDQVGSVQVQAGTLMHELGHNLDLSHAGLFRQPNCMPDYSSVMNYLYQTRGLTDAAGGLHIDYSYGFEAPLNEASLSAAAPLGPLNYRVRYFGPLGPGNTPDQAALVHCDGTPITDGALAVRSESPTLATPDWSNGTVKPLGTPFQFDLNFNGAPGEMFYDQPDWSSLNLQQIGARPNVDGLSADVHLGAADLGAADLGAADLGAADLGAADLGAADLGAADLGAADLGAADLGAADLGAADLGDADADTINLTTPEPPPSPSPACPAPMCGLAATSEIGDVLLQWAPPPEGNVAGYNIYRCAVIAPATSCSPAEPPLYSNVAGGMQTPSYLDQVNDKVDAGATCPATKTCYNTRYSYYVKALVVTANHPPVPTQQANTTTPVEVPHLFVIAGTPASIVYGSSNPTPTFQTYGDVAGSLPNASVTCGYGNPPGSVVPRNVGTYVITCTGPSTSSATDGVTYNASYLSYAPGSLTITQRPITVTAAASNKVYNGTTASLAAPTITSGTLAYTDTQAWTETYDTPDAGNTHVMTPAGIVGDGNGGANYNVKFTTISTGTIIQAPQTIAFAPLPDTVFGSPDFMVSATASSGLPVSFAASPLGACTVAGTTVHLTGPGSCTITASQSGGIDYFAAPSVQQTFNVTAPGVTYTNDPNLADFTNGITTYAQFDAIIGLISDQNLPYTPTAADVAAGSRVYSDEHNSPILVEFPSAVSKIRVFPNIDHYGDAYDGYQYTISGSNDGVNYTLLFDALSVNGAGEPFTLGSFTGTAPLKVNNFLTPGSGPGGVVGYEADFSFSTAYKYYRFSASTFAANQNNPDEELTAVAALP